MCHICGGPPRGADRGECRAIPGEKSQPAEWVPCHITCGREAQARGVPITVRWWLTKKVVTED